MSKNLIIPHTYDCREQFENVGPQHKYENIEKLLKQNRKVCFTRTYGTVLSFYSWLKKKVRKEYPANDYLSGRRFREELQRLSSNILVKVIDGKVDLKGSPSNPWLKEFFDELSCFFISFPDLLGMNGAWQWYSKGIQYPGLSFKMHPFYGTYFPTRFEHLELFDMWLNKSNLNPQKAIDIGTGCGVLAFYMLKYEFNNVYATDINPNAVHSIKTDLWKQGFKDRVKVFEGSFFAGLKEKFDLVVFNPPWIPGQPKTTIDKGIYFEENFFNDFFNEAANHLITGGRLIILFSDFALVKGVSQINPVKNLLEADNRFKVIDVTTKTSDVNKTSEFRNTKGKETVELWDIEFLG